MTFSSFKWWLFLFPIAVCAQVDEILVQPTINLSLQKGSRWGFNTAISQRTLLIDDVQGLHIQASQFVTYEIGFYAQLGAGVMYRELFDAAAPEELRTSQQYVYGRTYNAFKIAHRLRWDQRFRGGFLTHRWRYRLSGSVPLNGSKTDVKEFYLTGGVETLLIAEQGGAPGYDQRFSAGIGTQLIPEIKLQLVAEYRIEGFTANSERPLFFNVSLYYRL